MKNIEQQIEKLALETTGLKPNFDRQEEEYYQSTKVRIYDLVKQVISSPEAKKYWQQGMFNRKQLNEAIEVGINEGLRKQQQKMYTEEEVKILMERSIDKGMELNVNYKVIHKEQHITKWINNNLKK